MDLKEDKKTKDARYKTKDNLGVIEISPFFSPSSPASSHLRGITVNGSLQASQLLAFPVVYFIIVSVFRASSAISPGTFILFSLFSGRLIPLLCHGYLFTLLT